MRPTRRFLSAALLLAMLSVSMAIPVSCAHISPTAFVNCMQDSGKGAAFINAVGDILDGDNRVAVLEQLAITVGPDVLKCALEQIIARKAAGPAGDTRAKRAREYLDAHSEQALKRAAGVDPAARVGALPNEVPDVWTAHPAWPGADDPGANLTEI